MKKEADGTFSYSEECGETPDRILITKASIEIPGSSGDSRDVVTQKEKEIKLLGTSFEIRDSTKSILYQTRIKFACAQTTWLISVDQILGKYQTHKEPLSCVRKMQELPSLDSESQQEKLKAFRAAHYAA